MGRKNNFALALHAPNLGIGWGMPHCKNSFITQKLGLVAELILTF